MAGGDAPSITRRSTSAAFISRASVLAALEAGEGCVGSDEEGIGALARKGGERRIYGADCAGVECLDLQPDGGGGLARTSHNVDSVLDTLAGLTSPATRTACGTKSCSRRERFATT